MRFNPILSGGHGYSVVHCKTAFGVSGENRRTASSSSVHGLIPDDKITGSPLAAIMSRSGKLLISPDAIFQTFVPIRLSNSNASKENGELRNNRPRSSE
jgi:hypothetical protein